MAHVLVECRRLNILFTFATDPLLEQWALEVLLQLPSSQQGRGVAAVMNATVGWHSSLSFE